MLFLALFSLTTLPLCDAVGYNLAYRKPTWQTLEKYSSAKAVDGLYETSSGGRDQCAMSYPSSKEVTWMVDLEATYSIYTVVLYHKSGGIRYATNESLFLDSVIYISNTTEKEDGYVCYHASNHVSLAIHPKTTAYCGTVGRYVIYQHITRNLMSTTNLGFSAQAQIALCEVEVFGCPLGFYGENCSKPCPINCHHCSILTGLCLGYCTPGYDGRYCDYFKRINMALHRPTFQMTSIIDRHQSDRLVDGKVLAGIITQGVCTSTKENQVFAMWVVNLQRPRRIERISVFSSTDNKTWDANNGFTKRLLGFSIIVSNTTDRRDGVVCFQDTYYTASTIPDEVEIYCSVIGQYVFYYNERLPGIHYPQDYSKYAHGDLCEIEVSGCPIVEYGHDDAECTIPCFAMCSTYLENLSYKKRTWQSSTYDKLYSSDKAVDGMKSRHYSDGQCTITSPDQSITWWVNLQKQYRISFINLYFRTDNSTALFRSTFAPYYLGFAVYISNTADKDDGILCYKDPGFTKYTLPDHLTIKCEHSGKYVIYYNERRPGVYYGPDYRHQAFGDLCEVEVYGCPSPVADLAECSKPCPFNCETCYPSTGFCTKCKPGFEGSTCDIVCDAMNKAVITTDGFYNGSYNEMFTSNGQTFLPTRSGYARFILTLSGKATNIAKVSFTIHKAFNVIVAFTNGTQNFTRLYYDQFTEEEHWNVKVLNGFMSRVHVVRITVGYTVPLTISNLRLPLRSCFKNDDETTQRRQGMFKFVREIH